VTTLTDRLAAVRADLAALRAADPERRIFGADVHHHQLAAPWSAAQVGEFEARWGITLPAEYRAFVTTVGAAGAGPGYGLLPPTPVERDEFPRVVTRITTTSGEIYESGTPRRPGFGARSTPARPFPLTGRFEPSFAYDLPSVAAGATPYDGCLKLSKEGCGYAHLLVVCGPYKGQVWYDGMAAVRGAVLAPTGLGFLAWYERWLADARREVAA
jgi:hypothetical protein